jgi:hypothetical protein
MPRDVPTSIGRRIFAPHPLAYGISSFRQAKDETATLTEQINKIEREIDERVTTFYSVKFENQK